MAQYETPHWTGPPPRPERDTLSEIAAWLARYAFLFLMIFFVLLVVAAMAFLPSLRGDDVPPPKLQQTGGPQQNDAAIPIVPPTGLTLLNVATNPPGALVQIDIDSVGMTPLYRREVERKVHLLSIVKPGYARIDTILFADDLKDDSSFFFFVLEPTDANQAAPAQPRLANNVTPNQPRTQQPASVAESGQSSESINRPSQQPRTQPQETVVPPVQQLDPAPEPVVSKGSMTISSTPSGATVSVNGRVAGVTPLDMVDLDPGDHEVRFSMNGYADKTSVVTVRPGEQSSISASMDVASGTLVILAKPYGSIFIDGVLVKRDLDVEFETTLPQGPHVIVVSHRVLGSLTHNVVVGPTPKSIVFDFNNMNVTGN